MDIIENITIGFWLLLKLTSSLSYDMITSAKEHVAHRAAESFKHIVPVILGPWFVVRSGV